ncbi:MAG: hypothetical protein CL663_06940 [Bacteroidetes bacterium]|nr:hypothetical protein [Bacteroidota bacterium]
MNTTLSLDKEYDINDLKQMNFKQLTVRDFDYQVFELNSKIYFYEEINKLHLRLFCCVNKESYYL